MNSGYPKPAGIKLIFVDGHEESYSVFSKALSAMMCHGDRKIDKIMAKYRISANSQRKTQATIKVAANGDPFDALIKVNCSALNQAKKLAAENFKKRSQGRGE